MSQDGDLSVSQGDEQTYFERDANFFLRVGLALTVVCAGGFFLWAGFAPLDQGITVQGTVVVSGKRKAVQTLSPGVVSQILVREGDAVEQGQPLFHLDETQSMADVYSLQAQYSMAWASVARWISERDELSALVFPAELIASPEPSVISVLEGQRLLFESRRQAFSREQAGIRTNIEGGTAQLIGLQRARADLTAQAQSLRDQLANLQPLADNGYIPRNRLLEYQRQLSQVQQQMEQNLGESGRIEQAILESTLKLQQHREEYQKEVRSQLADAQLRALTLEQQLTSARFALQHSRINAPASGIAVNLAVHTEGAVVGAGETLLEVVPQGERLEVEGRVPTHLIDKVETHLPVDILFTAFNQSRTPQVPGRVSLISADQMLDERSGDPYYVLRTSVSDDALQRLHGLVIKPGMPAEIFVRIGERSLLNYLLKPLLDRANSALTEE